jgi:hypothetical protein
MALLRLPVTGAVQCGEYTEIEPRERIQAHPKPLQGFRRLAQLLAGGPQDSAHSWRLHMRHCEQAFKTPFFSKECQEPAYRLFPG